AAELNRSAQEGPAQTFACRREIVDSSKRIAKPNGSIDTAAIPEFGGKYRPIRNFSSEPEFLFVNDHEAVAGAQVQGEVDVPAEDLGQLQDEWSRESRFPPVLEERALDAAGPVSKPYFKISR